jgi:MFS family permease
LGTTTEGGLRAVLGLNRFYLWLAARFAGTIGYSAWSLSVLWLAYQISGSLVLSAIVLFVQYTLYAVTFIAGPFVDRQTDKRTVYLIVYPAEAVTAALLGVAVTTGHLTVPILLGAVIVMSVLEDFWWTADNTVPRILTGRENVLRAMGLAEALGGGGSLAGYSLGAALLVVVGPSAGAYLFAALLAASAILIAPVRIRSAKVRESRLLSNFLEGWRILFAGKGRPLLQIGTLFAAEGFFLGAPALLVTLFANRDFSGSSQVYGILFTAFVVGAVAGSLLIGRANPRAYLGRLLVSAMVAEGAAVAFAVAVLPSLPGSILAWFLVGLASSVPPTVFYSYLQATTAPDAIGRVISNIYLFPGVASAFGALAFGALSASLLPATLGYTVGIGLVAAGLAAFCVPAMRRMRF